jgi:aminopeptidase N
MQKLASRYTFLALLASSLLISALASAQTTYPLNTSLDILHYTFKINLTDADNKIEGETTILFTLKNGNDLMLDLVNLNSEGKGMVVKNIMANGVEIPFQHTNNRLKITLKKRVDEAKPVEVTIQYRGIAAGGLIADDNIFGERVFFGDNYPDRARNWLPCVDHPADKATVTWAITAPSHYKVVASGKLVSELKLAQNTTTTWDEKVPISTKVMVFGAANFAVDHSGDVGKVPVTTWVYAQNKEAGFYDFAIAPKVLAYYNSLIGPYPYEKLANVQSKTAYGGMENASNIFYFEESVTGKGEREKLIAHEIVHQWFGNSATEKDWPHAWLSEGFATYLTLVYVGAKYGQEKMNEGLITNRNRVFEYYQQAQLPIVNKKLATYPQISNLGELLSTNTYQKAGWVLHMLRNELGDEDFWQAVRQYYATYRDSIASTADFQHVAEEVSGQDLQYFFDQWLYGAGQPNLTGSWQFANGQLNLKIYQTQNAKFTFPLEIGLVYGSEVVVKKVMVTSGISSFKFSVPKPVRVILDPNTRLLFSGKQALTNISNEH